jgi:hypothetical protein
LTIIEFISRSSLHPYSIIIVSVFGVRKKRILTGTLTVTNTEGFLGDHSEGETPVPIPNTEVKPFSADGTAWATVWESRTLPRLKLGLAKTGMKSLPEMAGFFLTLQTDVLGVIRECLLP